MADPSHDLGVVVVCEAPLPSVTCISDVPWSKDLPSGFNLKHQHFYKLLESRTLQLVVSFEDPFHSDLFLVQDNDDTRN